MHWRNVVVFIMISFIFAACARNPERFYFGNYSQAEQYYKKGEYERAIQKYQLYIDENPEGNLAVISLYYIARSRQALGQIEEAQELYREIRSKHPNLVWGHFSEQQLKEIESAGS